MNDLTQYLAVCHQMLPADVVVFAGTQPISRAIDLFEGSFITHCGLVRQGIHLDTPDVLLSESTIENGKSGAQTNPLGTTLANYGPGARAWWLQLADEDRKLINWKGFYQAIGEADGIVPYDIPGLGGFLARTIPVLGPRIFQTENQRQRVCSAHVVYVLEGSKLLRGFNYSKVTPQDVVEMKLYSRCVQILGEPSSLIRFNTL